MTIAESVKEHVWDLYRFTAFKGRDKDSIDKNLSAKHHNSEVRILPKYDTLSVERVDENTDKVTLGYEDYNVEMNFEWAIVGSRNSLILRKVY